MITHFLHHHDNRRETVNGWEKPRDRLICQRNVNTRSFLFGPVRLDVFLG
jgi:hypothetical protein